MATTGPTVYVVSADANGKLGQHVRLGPGGALFDQANDDLALADGRVWVSDYQGNKLRLTGVVTG